MAERRAGREVSSRPGPLFEGLALLGIMALVLAVRALGFEWVFQGDGVVFPPADAQYHLRRAFYTFSNFPSVLLFDPYINFPGGASIPWPPLYDFTLGSLARLFASNQHGFEIAMAWASPMLAALCVIPIHATARRFVSPAAGLAAGVFFAFLPISVTYSRLGNTDHHSAVCLLGAWLLYLCAALAEPRATGARLLRLGVGLAVARAVLLLTWHGSLLYLALLESCLLLAAAASGRRGLLLAQSLSALGSLALVLPVLAISPTPLGGVYSSIALSRLHLLALSGVAFVCALSAWLEGRRPAGSPLRRVVRSVAAGLIFVFAVLVMPGPRHGLEPALRFLTLHDDVGVLTGEQSPLFGFLGRGPLAPATLAWGGFAWLLPLAPLLALGAARCQRTDENRRAVAWVLFAWSAFFGVLAIWQRRYGNDLAPAASILFPLLLYVPARALTQRFSLSALRMPLAAALAGAVWVLLISPALRGVYVPRLRDSLAVLDGDASAKRRAANGVAATLTRFAREVRRVTPETSAYLDSTSVPEYGVLAHANLGHALQYEARRATASDPFWAYIGQENWRRSFGFQGARSETQALRLARALHGRYAVTMPDAQRGTIVEQLHRFDGRAVSGRPRLAHFRLVTEARAGGLPIGDIFRDPGAEVVPYKLFEIVPGALLEVQSGPGSVVEVRLELRTATGRRIVERSRVTVGRDGRAQMRLRYASENVLPTHALGPYRVRIDDRLYRLSVSEQAVVRGDVISCCEN